MKILLASNNIHKAKEFKEIIESIIPEKIELILPNEIIEDKFDVEETGKTFIENAKIKAEAFYEKFAMPVISDDSGLEVDALDGEPGIKSARYSGEHGNDYKNRQKLLNELKNERNRLANFTAVLCYFDSDEKMFFEGKVFGNIINEERGDGGFGYDPIFVPEGYNETFSELPQDKKNQISHRAMALQRFCEWIAKKSG